MLKIPPPLKWIISTAITIFLLAGCTAPETETEKEIVYPYPFDTAKIEYTIEGNFEGSQVVYIKGNNVKHETHIISKIDDQEEKIDALILDIEEKTRDIDLNKKTGTKSTNPIYQELQKTPKAERTNFLIKLAAGLANDESAEVPEPKGKGNYAGQDCDIYDTQGLGEVCLWEGFPLYSSLTLPGDEVANVLTATKIEINIDIPDDTFNIPEDVTILSFELKEINNEI